MFSIKSITILGITILISFLANDSDNFFDTSFAKEIKIHSTNFSEVEDKEPENNNVDNKNDLCLRYENITKTIIICDGVADIPSIYDFLNNNNILLYGNYYTTHRLTSWQNYKFISWINTKRICQLQSYY